MERKLQGITDAAHAGRAVARARLAELVLVETPTADAAASRRITTLLRERYEQLGAEVRVTEVEAGVHLRADVSGRGGLAAASPVLLVAHSDTVWPIGTLRTMPWVEDGDIVRGPGSHDMKPGLVIVEEALALTDALGLDRRPVRVVVSCDEEIGSPSFEDDFREALDGVSCVLGFEAPHPDGAAKSGRWGSTRLRLRVAGTEAHAALDPDKGVSAIDELVDQLLAVRRIVRDAGDGVLLNVGTIAGGRQANVVAGEAEALLGLRFRDGEVERAVLGAVTGLAPIRPGAVVTSQLLTQRPAWGESADNGAITALAAVADGLGLPFEARPARGAADTNLAGALGHPTVDGLGPLGGGAHAAGEHSSLDSLVERVALLAAFVSSAEFEL